MMRVYVVVDGTTVSGASLSLHKARALASSLAPDATRWEELVRGDEWRVWILWPDDAAKPEIMILEAPLT